MFHSIFIIATVLCTINAWYWNHDHRRNSRFDNRSLRNNDRRNYTLWYFDIRGRGEQIRLLLIDNGIPFIDNRVKSEDWPKIKPNMPLYQMPVLYYGIGVPVAQSGAIMRFLAREHGLYSRSSERSAFIDQIYEATVDASAKYFNFTMSNNIPKADFVGTAKSELKKIQDLGFKHFSYPNLSNNLYIAGNKTSYADYALFEVVDLFKTIDSTVLDAVPLIKTFYYRMSNRPKLAAYLQKRP